MATTPNFNWSTPDNTGLVKNGALDIRTLGNSIDASLVDLKGGTTGQVLAKASNTDMDFTWATDASGIPATIFDAKGDIIAATAADTASRLAVGTNGQVLTADSTAATGLKWATASSGTPAFVGCIAYGAVNLAYSATKTAVSGLTTEIVDTDAFHSTSTNTSRMTIPSGKDGKYKMEMNVQFAGVTGPVTIYAYKNGAAITDGLPSGTVGQIPYTANVIVSLTVGTVVTGVATDYFEFFVNTTGASTLDGARYSFTYLGA